ncbi:MAG: methyltransferase domain-containing protein [Pseudonocardiaceae bacterium]
MKELDSAGHLPVGFGPRLQAVPREWFIPDQVWVDRQPVDRASQPDTWLHAVYSNTVIVTQFDDGRTHWPEVGEVPTCSASMPSAVAGMLHHLDVEDGQSVLEIGTGTGFNAALLADMVGPGGSVITVEVDPILAATAQDRLARAGFDRVRSVVGDATTGIFESAPFDRVICTASVQLGRVPYAWVDQTKPGGVIVTPVRADLTSGPLVRFIVDQGGAATGRMTPLGVEFMEVRSQRTVKTPDDNFDWHDDTADQKITRIRPWLMFSDFISRWALAVALPSCRYDMADNEFVWLRDPVSGSWASVVPIDNGNLLVRQKGIRRLWDEAEAAYRWWIGEGRPVGPDWVWTITPQRQTIQLDGDCQLAPVSRPRP